MKLKIKIPSNLSEIKLSQYQRFIKSTKDSEDELFISRQLVSIFCNLEDKVVDNIRAKDFESIVAQITETLSAKPEFIPTFKMDGLDYGFIPQLDDITVAEKADLDTFLKDVSTLNKAMNVLYRPIKIKRHNGYLIEDYKANGNGLDVPLNIALGANVFFCNLMTDLLNYIPNFIAEEVERSPEVSQILAQSGVGITAFINSQREVFSSLTKLVNLDYTKH